MKKRALFLGVVFVIVVLGLNSFQPVYATPLKQGSADLTLLDIVSDPPNPGPWDSLHYISHVENQGTERAEVWVWYYVDGARVTGENEYWGHLDPGSTREVDFGHSGLSEGWHTVKFVVDPEDAVAESNETNNEIEDTFCIGTCEPQYPDLVVEQIDWTPGSPLAGDSMHFTVHVQNEGTANTSPWGQVGVRLFIDGISVGDDYASNIAPGTTEFFDFYWTATSGCHTVRAVADYGDYIPESDEGNNERVEPCCVSSPDLAVEQIDWTPGSPLAGDSMHFTVHVQNEGTANTSPWGQVGTRLFIDGTSIGDDYTSNIAPGTTEFFDFYWTATAGHHTVRAVADYGDFIPESDENNNEREESFDVTCPTPSAPSLSSPSNGSSTCDTTPYFDWSSVNGVTSYRIQVDDSSSFSSPAINTTTSNSNYTPGTALLPSTYYWRVRSSNSCGDSSWSSVWSVTVLSLPGVPSLVSPSNGSTTDDSTPTLDWGSVSGATSYRVQVDDNSSFSSPEIDQTTSSSSYTPSSALTDGTYHWRVQASNSCGSGSWSAAWSFTIETYCPTPSAPSLYSPSDGSSTCDTTPYFDWSSVSGATSYRIQVDDSSSFTSLAIDTTASNSNYTPGTALSPSTYYWRVRASNSCGDSSWSSVWSVTILSPPGVPSLVSPSNGSTTDDSTPTLDWGSVSGATSYRAQVDNNSSFSSPEIDQTTSNTSYTPNRALADGTYYWRVQASNSCGSGSWSAAWSFTVDTSVSAPSNLDAAAVSQTRIDLAWQDNSPDESDFHIERSPNGSTDWTEIDTVGANVTSYSDTGLSCGTTYYYRVRAHRHGDGQYSGYSNVDDATTQACSEPRPDLIVTGIVGRPDGDQAWDSWQFDAYVKNTGEVAYGGGTTYRGSVDNVTCAEPPLPDLEPGEEKKVDFGWGGGALGEHTVCVGVDPSNAIEEEREDNNKLCQPFTVGGSAGDTTPPAAVTDLVAQPTASSGGVLLTWHAPGDDGNAGTASQYDVRYSASPINASNWPFATPVEQEPIPSPTGSAESMVVHVPFPGQVYYFAIKTADEVPNWSDLSKVASARSGQSADTIAPGRITDLAAATGSSSGEVDLTWTAPGDDGYSGTAHHYVVRWNTVPIRSSNWENSNDVNNEPTPRPAASVQSMTVSVLVPGQRYYFAIRAYDEAFNHSDVSNSADAVAYETPLPDLIVESLTVHPTSAYPGDTIQVTFTVRNSGDNAAGLHACTVYLAEYRNGGSRVQLANRNVSGPAAGDIASYNLSAQILPAQDPGDYYVIVVADSADTVPESNDDNNERDQYPITVRGTVPQVDLQIAGIEVTQGIQVFHLDDPDYHDPGYGIGFPYRRWWFRGPGNNEVRLVQGRTTIVRVYVDIGGDVRRQNGVNASLAYNTGSGWRSAGSSLNGPIDILTDKKPRYKKNQSLNFLIPGNDLDGPTLNLAAVVDYENKIPETNENNNGFEEEVELHGRGRLRVGLLPIKMIKDDQEVGTGEINDNVVAYVNYARAALPFPDWLEVEFIEPSHPFSYDSKSCRDEIADDELLSHLEQRWQKEEGIHVIVGVFPDDAWRGCSAFSGLWGEAYGWGGHHSVIVNDNYGSYGVLAHELGHLIPGLYHPWENSSGWPYDSPCLQEVGTAIIDFSWWGQEHLQAGGLVWKDCFHEEYNNDDYYDVMSYSRYRWMSPYSWEAWMSTETPTAQTRAIEAGADSRYLIISGLVYTDTTATLNPVWVSNQQIEPSTEAGDYCVQTLDTSDTLLTQQCFGLDFLDNESRESQRADTFLVSLPQSPSVAKVSLTQSDRLLNQIAASSSPPSVTITYPNSDETLTETFSVSWIGSDGDGDPLVYRLLYSADNGSTWSMLVSGITRTNFLVDPADLAGTEAGLFKVVASDGFHNGEDQSDGTFVVPRKAPVSLINASLDGNAVPLGTTVMLNGFAFDHEDGSVSDANIAWTSSLDGPLGEGSALYTSDLSPGVHQITLAVTDSDGMTGTHSVYLEVLQDADDDRMPDEWERRVGLAPDIDDAYEDADGDGLSNVGEFRYETDPLLFDTDYDGHDDLTEILEGADPLDADSVPPPKPGSRILYLPIIFRNHTPGTEPPNNPPNIPSNPSPADGATNQSANANLSWTGSDPDGDSVTYDVYFEANDSTPDQLVCDNVTSAFCDPGTLNYGTHCYWKVIARDSHGATRTGPVWNFTTAYAYHYDFDGSGRNTWPIRRTSLWEGDEWGGTWTEEHDGTMFIVMDDKFDFAIASPWEEAPSPPYVIKTKVKVHDPANLVAYGIIFGGDDGSPCPAYREDGCLEHHYRLEAIWSGHLEAGLKRIDEHEPDKGKGQGEQIIDYESVTASSGADDWHTWEIRVKTDGIDVYFDGDLFGSTDDTTYISEPYFGVYVSTDQYKPAVGRFDYYYVEPQ